MGKKKNQRRLVYCSDTRFVHESMFVTTTLDLIYVVLIEVPRQITDWWHTHRVHAQIRSFFQAVATHNPELRNIRLFRETSSIKQAKQVNKQLAIIASYQNFRPKSSQPI